MATAEQLHEVLRRWDEGLTSPSQIQRMIKDASSIETATPAPSEEGQALRMPKGLTRFQKEIYRLGYRAGFQQGKRRGVRSPLP
jgi:hypothetical protein